jgi:hypothetical protein
MKKLATLAVLAALATSAQAASITWGFGGKVYLNKGDATVLATDTLAPAVANGSYLALVYLGQNVSSYDLATLTSDIADTTKAAKVVDTLDYGITTTGKSSAIGKWNPNTSTYADANMASGASFAILFYNAEKSAFDYVYAYSNGKGDAYDSNILKVSGDNMTIASAQHFATGGTGGNAGVIAVPEPSVALMGLLGLGMLLKRRKV